ncbi:hypothetical protein Z043_126065, partial [Scleropages formosus]
MVKEVLVNQGENFVGRPHIPLFHKIFQSIGLLFSNGHLWKKQKKFTSTHFKSFAEGKKTIELYIQQECNFLCQAIAEE